MPVTDQRKPEIPAQQNTSSNDDTQTSSANSASGPISPGRTKGLAGFWSNQNDEAKAPRKKRFEAVDSSQTEELVVENSPQRLGGVVRAEDPGEWQKPVEVETGRTKSVASSFQITTKDSSVPSSPRRPQSTSGAAPKSPDEVLTRSSATMVLAENTPVELNADVARASEGSSWDDVNELEAGRTRNLLRHWKFAEEDAATPKTSTTRYQGGTKPAWILEIEEARATSSGAIGQSAAWSSTSDSLMEHEQPNDVISDDHLDTQHVATPSAELHRTLTPPAHTPTSPEVVSQTDDVIEPITMPTDVSKLTIHETSEDHVTVHASVPEMNKEYDEATTVAVTTSTNQTLEHRQGTVEYLELIDDSPMTTESTQSSQSTNVETKAQHLPEYDEATTVSVTTSANQTLEHRQGTVEYLELIDDSPMTTESTQSSQSTNVETQAQHLPEADFDHIPAQSHPTFEVEQTADLDKKDSNERSTTKQPIVQVPPSEVPPSDITRAQPSTDVVSIPSVTKPKTEPKVALTASGTAVVTSSDQGRSKKRHKDTGKVKASENADSDRTHHRRWCLMM